MGDCIGHQGESCRTLGNETSTLDTKEPPGDLCPLRIEAAWDGFENSLTCVTYTSFQPALRQTVRDLKRRYFPAGPRAASTVGTLSKFVPSLVLRAASVKEGIWKRWVEGALIAIVGRKGVASRWHAKPYPRSIIASQRALGRNHNFSA